jgi:hypothetical protein
MTAVLLWAVLFGSKFLVLEAVNLVFGTRVSLGGFFSVTLLILVLAAVTGGRPPPAATALPARTGRGLRATSRLGAATVGRGPLSLTHPLPGGCLAGGTGWEHASLRPAPSHRWSSWLPGRGCSSPSLWSPLLIAGWSAVAERAGRAGQPQPDAGRFGSGYKDRPKSDAGIRPLPMAEPVALAMARRLDGCGQDELVFCGPGGSNGVPRGARSRLSVGNYRRVYRLAVARAELPELDRAAPMICATPLRPGRRMERCRLG